MSEFTLALERDSFVVFSKSIKVIVESLKSKLLLPFIILGIFFLSLIELIFIKKLSYDLYRAVESPSKLDFFTGSEIKNLRDIHITLCETISTVQIINFTVGGIARKAMFGWDELIEDATLTSDDEFKNLIMQISNKFA